MNEIVRQITNMENLYWAWEKTRKFYIAEESCFDEFELASFEAMLDSELRRIRDDIVNGKYILGMLSPVAYPKAQGKDEEPRTRQAFKISVRDQVTWVAVINVIGPMMDTKMPPWSYAYRLHVPIYYEENEFGKKEIKFGWFRGSSPHMYRKWKQSWPMYRRHIAITSKIMSKYETFSCNANTFKQEELDEYEGESLEHNESIHNELKVRYLTKDYWSEELSGDVYWIGIDLEKFYPSVNIQTILDNLKRYFAKEADNDELWDLIGRLLDFRVNISGWSAEDLECINLESLLTENKFSGIPTGLFIAGFLANIAMLEIDSIVDEKLKVNRRVAHFRFVDDHVILADNFDELCKWVIEYRELLLVRGLKLNLDKTEPENIRFLIWETDELIDKRIVSQEVAKKSCYLDPDFPAPLMTQTLAKLSNLTAIDFGLLDEVEENQLVSDLEHLLLVDIPDHELRKDTRVSFASNKLAQLIPQKSYACSELLSYERDIASLLERIKDVEESNVQNSIDIISELRKQVGIKTKLKVDYYNKRHREELKLATRTYKLLLKATAQNYQKIRLWARIIEFCRRIGIDDLKPIFHLVDKIQAEHNCSEMASQYIHAYIFQILSEQIFVCFKLLQKKKTLHMVKERSLSFLSGILDRDFLKVLLERVLPNEKGYFMDARKAFIIALSFLIWVIQKGKIQLRPLDLVDAHFYRTKYELIDWENPFKAPCHQKLVCLWVWWIIKKTTDDDVATPNPIWFNFLDCFIKDNLMINELNWAIVALYPTKIPEPILERFLETEQGQSFLMKQGYGWLVEAFRGRFHQKHGKFINSIKNKFLNKRADFISLVDWVDWMFSYDTKSSCGDKWCFDPRLSEWTALEITKQIAQNHLNENILKQDYGGEQSSVNVYPSNYLIPVKWRDSWGKEEIPSWEQWRKLCEGKKVEIVSKSKQISDFRYTPEVEDAFNTINTELSLVNGLGSILIGLLLKSFELPPYWNLRGTQKVWMHHAKRRLNEQAVSTPTLQLIEACFSKRNKGTAFLRKDITIECIQDTLFDPPEIFGVGVLIKHIEICQRILKDYQLSVQQNQPRQLIPISLVQLTRLNNIYQIADEV